MSETITACENVCRDFSWIIPYLPLVASAVPFIAIAWAVRVYYLQNKANREAELRREQREAYRDFFKSTLAVNHRFQRFCLSEKDTPELAMEEICRARDDYETAFKILALSASPTVLKAAQKCKDGLRDHFLSWRNALEPFLGAESIQKESVNKEMRNASKGLTESIRKDEIELLKVMRIEEFSEPVNFETS